MTGRTPSKSKNVFLLLSSILALFAFSCSVGDYLSAYFNTYFNASRLYEEAEEEIASQQAKAPADTSFLPDYTLQSGTKTKLTSVVEKCSKILQDHPGSGLMDNSLMMIGKSYYYLNEMQKAERKFRELLDAYPESGFAPEATLLLSYTYYRMHDFDQSVTVASSVADSTGGDDDAIAGKAFYLLGQIDYEKKNYRKSITSFRFSSELAGSGEERAAAFMRIGSISLLTSDTEAALEAYRDAEDEASEYGTEYHARMGQVTVYTVSGDLDEARGLLEDLRSNSAFREYYGEIDLALANLMASQGEIEEAVEEYYFIDTSYARTEVSAQSHFKLGYLYETHFRNYDSALTVYGRGKVQAPKAEINKEMVRRSDLLKRYQTTAIAISRLSLERKMILNPELRDSLNRVAAPDSGKAAAPPDSATKAPEPPPLPDLASVDSSLARNKSELAGLFYSGLAVLDSAEYWYENLLREHPESPYAPRALYTLAEVYTEDHRPSGVVDSLYREIIRLYPETVFADEARRILGYAPRPVPHDPAVDLYAQAESLMTIDSTVAALDSFKLLVRDYSSSPVAPKAHLAIAWIYEQTPSSSDSAIAYYRRLVEHYPASTYSTVATKKLEGIPAGEQPAQTPGGEQKSNPPTDTTGVKPADSPGDMQQAAPDSGVGAQTPEEESPGDSLNQRRLQRPR